MQSHAQATMYAFLSRMFRGILDQKLIAQVQNDDAILDLVLGSQKEWFLSTPLETLEEVLNIDYTSLFLMHDLPIESSVLDDKNEVLVGLQNPVMQFYFEHGYELNLSKSEVVAPDHLSLECAFMQHLVLKGEQEVKRAFLQKHLLQWAPSYLLSMADAAQTPFYQELCLLAAEFFISEYEDLC